MADLDGPPSKKRGQRDRKAMDHVEIWFEHAADGYRKCKRCASSIKVVLNKRSQKPEKGNFIKHYKRHHSEIYFEVYPENRAAPYSSIMGFLFEELVFDIFFLSFFFFPFFSFFLFLSFFFFLFFSFFCFSFQFISFLSFLFFFSFFFFFSF